MVVITVIDKSCSVTFSRITGEPLVFEIVEIKAAVVVIKVDLIDIAIGIAVSVSADVVVDVVDDVVIGVVVVVLVGPVADDVVDVIDDVVVDVVVDVGDDAVVDVVVDGVVDDIVDDVVDVDDFVLESVVFSGSVLIGLMGIGVGEIGGGNVVVVLG